LPPELVFAARLLRKSPGFTLVAATSLALAIGANTAIFSVAKQLLFERLDVPHAANLRLLTSTDANFSYPTYEQLRAQNQVLGDLLAFHATAVNATVGDNAERVLAHEVSGNYYAVLGVQPQLGRAIRPGDDTAGSEPVVVISDEFWEREFARSPAVLGQSIALNDVPVTIVGVNPKGFTGAASTLPSQTPAVIVALAKATLVTPSSDGRNWLADPTSRSVNILARTKPGVSDGAAQAALDTQFSTIVRATLAIHAGDAVPRLTLRDGSRGLFAQQQVFATPISVLMIFLGLVLLLACANIATLMLVRGARRQREMSVRLALGAGPARILRQMLIESLLLAAMGGASGLALAYVGRGAIARFTPHFDWQVFGFTALISIVTGVLFSLAPALAAMRAEIADGVKSRGLMGKPVVGFQIALATLLIISAGLFIRSLARLTAVNPGFRTDHLLLAQIVLPQNRYPAGANVVFHQRMEQAIANIPGVASVSAVEAPYLSGERLQTNFLPQGEAIDASTDQAEPYNAVGIHFFDTLGIPIVFGRAFSVDDTVTSPKVAVINQRLAAARFPNSVRATNPSTAADVSDSHADKARDDRSGITPSRACGRFGTAIGECSYAAGPDRFGSRGRAATRVAHVGLRARRAGAGIGWDLRRDGLLGRAAHQGDRHPNGAWRDPAADSGHGASRSLVVVGGSDRARCGRVIARHTVREVDALRHRSVGSGHGVGRSRAVANRRLGGKLDSSAACGERAAGGGAPSVTDCAKPRPGCFSGWPAPPC
jgi:predicted permease